MTDFHGDFAGDFLSYVEALRLKIREQAPELASEMGLAQFQQGFRYPLTIRFSDALRHTVDDIEPSYPSQPLPGASLRFRPDADGYHHELVYNVLWLGQHNQEADALLRHEMVHIFLNDNAVSPEAANQIPAWFGEGLAITLDKTGENFVKQAIERESHKFHANSQYVPKATDIPRFWSSPDLTDLSETRTDLLAYWIIQYLIERGGTALVQQWTRQYLSGKSTDSICLDTLGDTSASFLKKADDYAARLYNQKIFTVIRLPDQVPPPNVIGFDRSDQSLKTR